MTDKKDVIKHSAAIQRQNNITLLQRRAWNVLLANAYDELPTEEWHDISLPHLLRTLEFNSHNDNYLKESLKALVSCSVEWNVLDKDGSERWGVAALLAEVEIQDGICTYAYGPKFRRLLHNPRMYARLCLSLQNRFASKHALALWELCVDYLGAERDYGETSFISLDDFRRLMGVASDEYPRFNNLTHRVIKPAVADIHRVADFRVMVEYQRHGRKVTAQKFKIRRVTMLPEGQGRPQNVCPDLEEMPLIVQALQDAGLALQDTLEIWQQGFDGVEPGKRPTGVEFDEYVREKIHLLKRQKDGAIHNPAGFLLRAIRENYANPAYAAAQRARTLREAQRKGAELERRREDIEREAAHAREALWDTMLREQPHLLEEAAPEVLDTNPFLHTLYTHTKSVAENYQEHPFFAAAVHTWLKVRFPDQCAAVEQAYAPQLAALDAELQALEAGGSARA